MTLERATTAELRHRLQELDDLQLEAFCQDHFPQVAAQFGSGQSRDAKVNRLIDHCLRSPAERRRLVQLLFAGDEQRRPAAEPGHDETARRTTGPAPQPDQQSYGKTAALVLFVSALGLVLLILALAPTAFRCVLEHRASEALVALIIALAAAAATAFSELVAPRARVLLRATYGGIALGLLLGIGISIVLPMPSPEACLYLT